MPSRALTRQTALETLLQAVRDECAKFAFPDEDRPELYNALLEYDDAILLSPIGVEERAQFEEAAFKQRFLSSLTKTKPGEFGPVGIHVMSKACPMKVDFVRRNEDGSYVDEGLNYAWWAWQEARKS